MIGRPNRALDFGPSGSSMGIGRRWLCRRVVVWPDFRPRAVGAVGRSVVSLNPEPPAVATFALTAGMISYREVR